MTASKIRKVDTGNLFGNEEFVIWIYPEGSADVRIRSMDTKLVKTFSSEKEAREYVSKTATHK